MVSVIVPCFDVERYVEACLASVLDQTRRDLEVVAIDDGSTDSTARVLAAVAASDARVKFLSQPNRGLGATRNVGVDVSNGRYLTFVDSDDLLPPCALERMVRSAEASGADVVTGVAYQFDSRARWRAASYGALFDADRTGRHLAHDLELVYDQMACAKLFRSSFWRDHELRFPEGVLYEDVGVVMRAHWRAASVDVISSESYDIRRREVGAPSITQDRYRPGSAAARFAALGDADTYLRDEATERVWTAHGTKICLVDVRLYARLVETAPAAWTKEFLEAASTTLSQISPDAVRQLNTPMRLLHSAVVERNPDAVVAAVGLLSGDAGRSWRRAIVGSTRLTTRHTRLVWRALRREPPQRSRESAKTTSTSTT